MPLARETRVESRLSALSQIALVAAILGVALALVFLPLLKYSLAVRDLRGIPHPNRRVDFL